MIIQILTAIDYFKRFQTSFIIRTVKIWTLQSKNLKNDKKGKSVNYEKVKKSELQKANSMPLCNQLTLFPLPNQHCLNLYFYHKKKLCNILKFRESLLYHPQKT